METLLTLNELLREALAHGGIGFTLRAGRHPLIYSAKGVQTYDTRSSSSEDIEELLRRLMSSRQMREFRAQGVIRFTSMFEGSIPLRGEAKIEGDDIHVEIRKMSA